MKPSKRSHWDVPVGSVWEYMDPVTGKIILVKVAGKFKTVEGVYANLRDPLTGRSCGNCVLDGLLTRVRKERAGK